MNSPCPCGCGVTLIGRQKAATPACRQRLSRGRKAVVPETCHTLPENGVESPKCDKILDVPTRFGFPEDSSEVVSYTFPDRATASAYAARQRTLAENRCDDLVTDVRPELRFDLGKKDGVPTGRFQCVCWYAPLYALVDCQEHKGKVEVERKEAGRYSVSVRWPKFKYFQLPIDEVHLVCPLLGSNL
jgi:hypothetical protein